MVVLYSRNVCPKTPTSYFSLALLVIGIIKTMVTAMHTLDFQCMHHGFTFVLLRVPFLSPLLTGIDLWGSVPWLQLLSKESPVFFIVSGLVLFFICNNV